MATTITKPMLAVAVPIGHPLTFPKLATPKIDGIRALVINGKLVSRSFKPIPNRHVREALESMLPDGADGEVLYGSTFQQCTSAVMSGSGPSTSFTFYWFDYVKDDLLKPYTKRIADLQAHFTQHRTKLEDGPVVRVVPLIPQQIINSTALDAFEAQCHADGFEGVMLRKPDGKYKTGRSTLNEALLLKIKRFSDAEAVIVGVEELQHNNNEATLDAFGLIKRSTAQGNKVAGGLLGAFVVETEQGVRFKIGTGLTAAQRQEYWDARDSLPNKRVKYRSMDVGVKDAPRHPVFVGFRDPDDM